ncbi:MAG: RagB/SusD family nutrient uptake outer membrane protein [Bacteroidales bacterium]|nr:RagB/SusD family nutrient uptake outer membrane protein [Bacteroidales bacterium]
MKYYIKKFILMFAVYTLITACSEDFLSIRPQGSTDEAALQTEDGIELLLASVYNVLTYKGGIWFGNASAYTNWLYGSCAGGEATKASNAGDLPWMQDFELLIVLSSNNFVEGKWITHYACIARANSAMKTMAKAENLSSSLRSQVLAELKFLRALSYFELRRAYKMVPWIDETFTENDPKVRNDQDVYPKIEADLQSVIADLPEITGSGRANKWAATALLAKVYMYQGKFTEAEPLLKDVIDDGVNSKGVPFSLMDNFSDVYHVSTEGSNTEAVFEINCFTNAARNNANIGWLGCYPIGLFTGSGYGFFHPTYDLVNSFQVDANGLPYLDNSYRTMPSVTNVVAGVASTDTSIAVDPRLDWTVCRPDLPVKDFGMWKPAYIRDMVYGGPFFANKILHWNSEDAIARTNTGNTMNYHVIRLADVILMYAECLAENNKWEDARDYVNMIRLRAKDSDVVMNGALRGANYRIDEYPVEQFDSKDEALQAIRFERKLELALEGHRFFDLARWGASYAKQELDAFTDYEQNKIAHYALAAEFNVNRVYFPIPLTQIQTAGKDENGEDYLQQNTGY